MENNDDPKSENASTTSEELQPPPPAPPPENVSPEARGLKGRGPYAALSFALIKLEFCEAIANEEPEHVFEILKAHAENNGLSHESFAQFVGIDLAEVQRAQAEWISRTHEPDHSPWSWD